MDSTTNESSYRLFSIRQAAHACNLSRSSLIRLEEKGMLTPAHTDAKTGYRYYDTLFRTTFRYALLRLSLVKICSISDCFISL